MTCREIVDFLMQYLEGELPAHERAVFEEHMNECPCCVKLMKSYEQTVKLAKDCPCNDPAAAKPPEALVKAILAARKPRQL